MKIKGMETVKDLEDFKKLGYTEEATQDPYVYERFYKYTPGQIAPLFNFVEKVLGEGYYKGKEK